jgi:hypothetical protein
MRKSLGALYIQRLTPRPPASGSTDVITFAPPHAFCYHIRVFACVHESIAVLGYPML